MLSSDPECTLWHTYTCIYIHTAYTQKKLISFKRTLSISSRNPSQSRKKTSGSSHRVSETQKYTQHKYLANINGNWSRNASLVTLLKTGKEKLSKMPGEGDVYKDWRSHREADKDSKGQVHISIIQISQSVVPGGCTHASTLLDTPQQRTQGVRSELSLLIDTGTEAIEGEHDSSSETEECLRDTVRLNKDSPGSAISQPVLLPCYECWLLK